LKNAVKYQPQIDGLRGISVLAVIFYHLNSSWLPGGYLGVDVFFVISGYLITSIILVGLANKNFSILTFYERRIRRILPSFLFVISLTFLTGSLILPPADLMNLSASQFASVLFSSNLYFLRSIAYSAGPTEWVPLLHTWSLSVEEQFYLVVPAILMVVSASKKFRIKYVLFAFLLGSFVIYSLMLFLFPRGAFYLLPSRAWELLIGSLLAACLFERKDKKVIKRFHPLITYLALGILFFSLIVLKNNSYLWGFGVVIPVICTVTIIRLSADGLHQNRILDSRLLTSIGRISYSAYLIHYPLIVLWKTAFPNKFNLYFQLLLLLLCLFLAAIQTKFIEMPFRDAKRIPTKFALPLIFSISFLLCGLGFVGKATNGFDAIKSNQISHDRRYLLVNGPKEIQILESMGWGKQITRNAGLIASAPFVLVIGDSMASDITFAGNLTETKFKFLRFDLDDECMEVAIHPRIKHSGYLAANCALDNTLLVNYISAADAVIIAADWEDSTYAFGIELAHKISQEKQTLLIGPFNFLRIASASYLFAASDGLGTDFQKKMFQRVDKEKLEIDKIMADSIANYRNITFISKYKLFCHQSVQSCDIFNGDKLLWRDDLHVNLEGAKVLGPLIVKAITRSNYP
jgi:peptidoglycan/LPS O-acetylase OafA/YrhL